MTTGNPAQRPTNADDTAARTSAPRAIVALAGGVGGAKLAHGLQQALPDPGSLTVIVNTADDFDLYGLRICPDIDTVVYTLSGWANPATGWGVRDDTFETLGMLARTTGEPWFRLGDRDFATHIARTDALRRGQTLAQITDHIARALGATANIVPMSNEPVATLIDTAEGRLDFQQYFVGRQHRDDVQGITFDGVDAARPAPGVLEALAAAEAIIFCPSNPFVSINPLLAVPGFRDALAAAQAPRIAVSPIIGGAAVKGPAAQMLASLGHEVSALGVARLYTGLLDGYVIDHVDADQRPAIEALGMRVLQSDTYMQSVADRERLAAETLAFAEQLRTTQSAAAAQG